MQIAVLTFDGFNELDSFVAAAIVNRMKAKGWMAHITSPTPEVTSMNGVTIQRQKPLEFAAEADAVLIGSGIKTREIAADPDMLARIMLDPSRQLIGAQCSGTLILAKLGSIGDLPACTDLTTKPWVIEAGVDVLDTPFVAYGNVATAGGMLGVAISGDMADRTHGNDRRCQGSDALCRPGGREGRLYRARARRRHAVPACGAGGIGGRRPIA